MKTYEVSWIEYHSIVVKAKDEDEAQELADENPNKIITCKNVGSEEVKEVELDELGYIKNKA